MVYTKNKKVLFVLPNMHVGGIERVKLTLIEHFVLKDIECHLALRLKKGELIMQAENLCPVHELTQKGMYQFIPRLTKLINKLKPTHLITAFDDIGWLSWIAIRRSNHQVIWIHSVHNKLDRNSSRSGLKGHLKYLTESLMASVVYKHANKIITVSNGIQDDLLDRYRINGEKIVTIYNPIVPSEVFLDKPTKKPFSGTIKLIALGRLVTQKGFDILIEAMPKVKTNNWTLEIWGDGPEKEYLNKLIKTNKLCKKIKLRGYTSEPLKVLQESDIYIMPSRHEGLPTTLIEAMTAQCQLISTDCKHGPNEILENGKLGQLIPVADTKSLSQAIEKALNKDVYFSPEKMIESSARFDKKNCTELWLSLIK